VLLLASAALAHAAQYTDVYYDTAEPGWGVFLVQSDTFQFLAFFIYGPDGKPTWYTAWLVDDGTGNYSGSVARSVTGCTNPANNVASLAGRFNLALSQIGDASAALTFTFSTTRTPAPSAR